MTRLWIIVGFVVALAAGVALGLAWDRGTPTRPAGPHAGGPGGGPGGPGPGNGGGPGGWLAAELQLTPEQRDQFNQIWSESARRGGRDHWTRRSQLRQQRDEAIFKLIPEASHTAYDQIRADYDTHVAALEAEWKQSFQTAVEKTRQLLTEAQRQKYDQIIARHAADRQRRGDGNRPPRGPENDNQPPYPPAPTKADAPSATPPVAAP